MTDAADDRSPAAPPAAAPVPTPRADGGGGAERWLALALRTAHLAAVVGLGAALLGAPFAPAGPGLAVLATGTVLLLQDLRAGRVAPGELAGAVVLFKLVAVAAVALAPVQRDLALAANWGLLVLSSASSHAPRRWRHWPLWRRRAAAPRHRHGRRRIGLRRGGRPA